MLYLGAGGQDVRVGGADLDLSDLTLENITPHITWEQVGRMAGLVEQT